ncbi:MAG TPA: adenylate/guanylate cyclase domain-containing protein [Sphingobium sp.]|nr:adenylate/guanylate cyclase domain-containing protein [Sphingobium sp.]
MILRRPKRIATGLGVVLFAAALALVACRYFSILAGMENIAADIRIAALQPAAPQSDDVVILALDEATLAQFPYRSPVDRAFLAELLRVLEAKGAKVIGLDVILDQPTEDAKDAALARTIRDLKTPLFVSYTATPSAVNEEQLDYLNAFVPAALRAEANMLSDPFDGAVRWINPGGDTAERPRGFVFKALALAGHPAPPRAAEIAWHSHPDPDTAAFASYPAATAKLLPDAWIRDKIVLIGAVLSLTDRHRTPLAIIDDGERGMMPGVLIQAHGIAQYLEGRQAPRLPAHWNAVIALLAAGGGLLVSLFKRGLLFHLTIGLWCLAGYWAVAFLGYSHGLPLLPVVLPSLAFLFSLWMMDLLIGRAERRQREYVQGAFSRYVSPAVVDQLVNDPAAMAISGTRREATFIFTDIAGFTTLSEQLSSEALADTLNAYLDGACAIILRHEGTIDKFIGDAIMAIFNAPIPQPDHAARAVRCALELDAYAEAFRQARNDEGIPIGVTRIGIHTGSATIGNFGSSSRMDFTALGDTVNIAARTEGVNKYFGTRICCTDDVVRLCPDLAFRPIGDIILKGKLQSVTLWTPMAADADPAFIADYAAAFALLRAESPEAAPRLRALGERCPDDPIIAFHLNRIASGHLSARVTMEDK